MVVKYLDAKRIRGSSTGANTITFQDDFDTDSWSDVGSKILVDTTGQTLDFNVDERINKHQTAYDLGSTVSDSAWVLRAKINYTTVTKGSSGTSVYRLQFGLSSTNHSSHITADSQDFLGMANHVSPTGASNRLWIIPESYENSTTGTEGTVMSHALQTETVYVEIIRVDPTTLTLEFFSDSGYSTSVEKETMTVSSGINNLQYIKVGNSYSAAENAVGQELIGTIDDIKFYNGVTSATQDEKATLVDSNIPASDANWTTVTALTADTSTATPTNLDTASWDCNGADGDTTKISLTDGQIFPKDSSFTFSTWIKPDSKQTFCILDDDGGTDSVVIFAAAGGDAVEYKVWKDASTHSGGEATFSGGFAAGSWYNVVCTFDKDTGTTESYVNYSTNVNSDTEAGVTTVATNTSWKMIGNSSETYGGLMLESAIWNKVLTANERRDLYYGGSGGSGGSAGAGKKANTIASANLVCYWDGSDITAPITNQSTLVKTKIPENTLFDETDTYRTYFLKSSAWKRANPIINGFSAITVDPYTSGSTASTNAGWTLVNTDNSTSVSEGTGQSFHIDKSQDKLFWNTKTGADNSGSQVYYDCGVLSDTWILQFKLKMNGRSDNGNQGVITAIGVKSDIDAVGSADASGGTYSPVQNYARFMFYSQSGASQLRGGVAGACGDLWGCDGNDSNASPNITGVDGTKTWYCQIKQTDEDTVVFTAGTDAYGGTTNGATATTNTALSNFTGSTHNFRYFFVETVSLNNGQSNRQHGYISEVKLADGVTSF